MTCPYDHESCDGEPMTCLVRESENLGLYDVDDLIARSSLGTPAAKALRSRTPHEVVERIMRKVEER